jgi:outer membrane protein assembly factor BamA
MLHVNFACILYALICCPISAQTSWKAEHCSVLARASEPAGPKVIIDDIVLDSSTDIAATVWNQIVSETKRQAFSGDNWVEELREVNLRGELENQGYFTPDVAADAKVVSSSSTLEHVVVHARVRGGIQYKLSRIQFRSQDPERHLAYSTEELRTLIPLHDGDIFSVEKVRNGIDALKRHYDSRGYIDFVPTVETQIDDAQQQIAVLLSLDEGIQFRLAEIETVGLDARLEKELRSIVKPGDVVNLRVIADFYRNHKSELPEEVLPEDTQFHRNIKQKTVDAFFDFRSCSQLLQN